MNLDFNENNKTDRPINNWPENKYENMSYGELRQLLITTRNPDDIIGIMQACFEGLIDPYMRLGYIVNLMLQNTAKRVIIAALENMPETLIIDNLVDMIFFHAVQHKPNTPVIDYMMDSYPEGITRTILQAICRLGSIPLIQKAINLGWGGELKQGAYVAYALRNHQVEAAAFLVRNGAPRDHLDIYLKKLNRKLDLLNQRKTILDDL